MTDWPAALVEIVRTITGPLIGAAIAFYGMRVKHRERLSASIIWDWVQEGYDRELEEPILHIHNRSDMPVLLAKVELRRGLWWRKKGEYPLFWNDEPAFHFPYKIEAGESWNYRLDKRAINDEAKQAGRLAHVLGWFHWPYVVIMAKTVAGSSIVIDAADATPYQDRPRWLQR